MDNENHVKTEIWEAISGYHRLYEVSNIGRVRSLPKKTSPGLNILRPGTAHRGYRLVCLCKQRKVKVHSVHSLVARAFIGPRPGNLEIDHINMDPSDNKAENLRYLSHRENSTRGKVSKLKKNKTSKYVGVSKNKKGLFTARIRSNGKSITLGTYIDEYVAGCEYARALEEIKATGDCERKPQFVNSFTPHRYEPEVKAEPILCDLRR